MSEQKDIVAELKKLIGPGCGCVRCRHYTKAATEIRTLRTKLAAAEKVVEAAEPLTWLKDDSDVVHNDICKALTAYHNTETTNGGAKC